jgi:hypothetical protein
MEFATINKTPLQVANDVKDYLSCGVTKIEIVHDKKSNEYLMYIAWE